MSILREEASAEECWNREKRARVGHEDAMEGVRGDSLSVNLLTVNVGGNRIKMGGTAGRTTPTTEVLGIFIKSWEFKLGRPRKAAFVVDQRKLVKLGQPKECARSTQQCIALFRPWSSDAHMVSGTMEELNILSRLKIRHCSKTLQLWHRSRALFVICN